MKTGNPILGYGEWRLLLEQTGYERQLDRQFSTPAGAEQYRKDAREMGKAVKGLSADTVVDIVSALIEGIPGIGQLVSAGIDIGHALSYLLRFYLAKEEAERIEYGAMTILTLGSSLVPVGGNLTNIAARGGIKKIIQQTPTSILQRAKDLGLYQGATLMLKEEKWKYSILLLLGRLLGSELKDFFAKFSALLTNNLKPKLQAVPLVGAEAILALDFLLALLKELDQYSELASKLGTALGE